MSCVQQRALTVVQRGMQDYNGASVYYEVDLPAAGRMVETIEKLVIEDPHEELSGEGDVIERLEERGCHGDDDPGRKRL